MARKAKKRLHPMPPLSFGDKLIYWTIVLLLCAMYILLLFGTLYLRDRIAFADTSVIAVEDNISTYWLGVPWMTFFLMTFILWVQPYQARKPIFGRRNFKYGPPAYPKIYPVFMKNKPYVFESDRKKKDRKRTALILLTVLLISFIPWPWSLYGRDCLQSDGSIAQYNMFNGQVHHFSPEEVSEIRIKTYRYGPRRTAITSYGVQMVFVVEGGKTYTFEQREFRYYPEGRRSYWLTEMLNIKRCYDPGIIQYDLKDFQLLLNENWSEAEKEIICQLFGK